MSAGSLGLPRCWWCREVAPNIREMDLGREHHPVCAPCYLALLALRQQAQAGKGVG